MLKAFDLYRELRSVGFQTFIECFSLFQASFKHPPNRYTLGDMILAYLETHHLPHKGKPYTREASHALRIFEAGLEIQALQLCIDSAPRLPEKAKELARLLLQQHHYQLEPTEEDSPMNAPESERFQQKVVSSSGIHTISAASLYPIKTPPKLRLNHSTAWQRNPRIAKESLQWANYTCEIDASHITFLSPISQTMYMEAHHLIPMQAQHDIRYSLDVHGNIVSLCPNCHRGIHLATTAHKQALVATVFQKRHALLKQQGLHLSLDEVLRLYTSSALPCGSL